MESTNQGGRGQPGLLVVGGSSVVVLLVRTGSRPPRKQNESEEQLFVRERMYHVDDIHS